MTKPITDKAEIALEYPDKLYVGTFDRSSRFEAHLDPTGIALILAAQCQCGCERAVGEDPVPRCARADRASVPSRTPELQRSP
jgi:hypothetical protein